MFLGRDRGRPHNEYWWCAELMEYCEVHKLVTIKKRVTQYIRKL